MGLVRSSVQWESTWTFIWTPVERPARKVQASTVLVLSARSSAAAAAVSGD